MSAAAISQAGPRARTGRRPSVTWIDRSWGSGPGTHGGYLAAPAGYDAGPAGRGVGRGPSGACAGHALPGAGRRPAAPGTPSSGSGATPRCAQFAEQGGALVLVGRRLRCVALRSDHNGSCAPTVLGPDDCPPLALPRAGRVRSAAGDPARYRGSAAGRRRAGRAGRLDVPGRPSARRRGRDGADRRPAAGAVRHLDDPAAGALRRAGRALRHCAGPRAHWALVRIRADADGGWAMDDARLESSRPAAGPRPAIRRILRR